MSEVSIAVKGAVYTVIINRPEVRNCVDRRTAEQLIDAFPAFDGDDRYAVAVLCGAGGTFCAGADLKAAVHVGDPEGPANRLDKDMTKDGHGTDTHAPLQTGNCRCFWICRSGRHGARSLVRLAGDGE